MRATTPASGRASERALQAITRLSDEAIATSDASSLDIPNVQESIQCAQAMLKTLSGKGNAARALNQEVAHMPQSAFGLWG